MCESSIKNSNKKQQYMLRVLIDRDTARKNIPIFSVENETE